MRPFSSIVAPGRAVLSIRLTVTVVAVGVAPSMLSLLKMGIRTGAAGGESIVKLSLVAVGADGGRGGASVGVSRLVAVQVPDGGALGLAGS